MKSRYGIGLFILSFVLIYLLSNKLNQTYQTKEETSSIEHTISTDGQAVMEKGYYLFEVNGYVVVFLGDKETPYEYTDIVYEELPELLRLEIQNGKYLENTEALYGFLENYSS